MTDMPPSSRASLRTIVSANMKKRYQAERRFRAFGLAMIVMGVLACGALIFSILAQSVPALTENRLHLAVDVTPSKADPAGKRDPVEIRQQGDFFGLVQDGLLARYPTAEADGVIDDLLEIATSLAAVPIGKQIAADPSVIGKKLDVSLPINDDLDMFFKGAFGKTHELVGTGTLVYSQTPDNAFLLQGQGAIFQSAVDALRSDLTTQAKALEAGLVIKRQRLASGQGLVKDASTRLEAAQTRGSGIEAAQIALDQAQSNVSGLEAEIRTDTDLIASLKASVSGQSGALLLDDTKPTVLVETQSGTFKVGSLTPTSATAKLIVRPKAGEVATNWKIVRLATAQSGRAVNDATIAFGRQLQASGAIKPSLNSTIFTNSDSNEPELSGLLSAFVGSLLTLAITALLAVPIGVATAVYLEEFAPKNWLTDLIEVNINNLAAVPSIVFGLLGFAVFLSFFGMPRAAPLVGGIVLALMSLPVIIIASRAALKAVPPSIREAALGVGASKMQAIFHHVLPLALPGIMTGSILAMAHALGETAPLLMIGMVAFIADVPAGFTDSATVLPVELFMWAGRPERAWEPRTALAIIALLVFMILMNALAIFLRRKFERRW
jgi:phosphate transport system permease protein